MITKLRSIPKTKSRFTASSIEGRERAELLQFREKYKQKKGEFVKDISQEAQKLQNIAELKESEVQAMNELGKRKTLLNKTISDLETKMIEIETTLGSEFQYQTDLINIIHKQIKEEQAKSINFHQQNEGLEWKIQKRQATVKELQVFINQHQDIRHEWLQVKQDLEEIQKQRQIAREIFKKEQETSQDIRKEIIEKDIALKKTEDNLKKFAGNLSDYAERIRQATQSLNEEFKNRGYPIQYEIPSEQLTVIPFPRKRN